MNDLLVLNHLLLAVLGQIFIKPEEIPWESTQVCYVDSIYQLIYPLSISRLYVIAEKETFAIKHGFIYSITDQAFNHINYQFTPPDTYFLSFPQRLENFQVNLVLETEKEILKQRLRLYAGQRKIIVYRDIRPQKMFCYEGDNLIAEFLVSTGRKGRETALGQHQILTKRYQVWYGKGGFWMTWWQSFAVVGKLMNGLHALNNKRYERLLGQPTSTGCVRVSQETGVWLFYWTDIGISFEIRSKF